MKYIVRFYAGIVGASILCGSGCLVINPISAQSSPSIAPQTSSKKSDAENLNLFLRAFRDFGQGNATKTTSNLSLRATAQGTAVEENIQIQAIVQKPNRFRADIIFGDVVSEPQSNASKRRYQIVSDGKTVWIYRPDTKEYLVQTYAEFDQSSDSFLMGAVSGLFLKLPADLESSFSDENLAIIASNPTLVTSMYKEMDTQFKGYQQDKTGKSFAVYSMGGAKSPEQINISLWVEPQTATLQQFQVSGQDKGVDISIQEVLLERIANPKIEPNTFRFIVPKGAKRSKTLSISPIGN
jgi:outer membrane lipoprotein-sorting protein